MELPERARGMMVGIGAGNLLGIRFEGWSTAEQLRETHPDGVRDIEARPGYPDDDDLAQAILLAEACAEFDALDPHDLMRRLWHWAEINGAGMGIQTGDVLERYAHLRDKPADGEGGDPFAPSRSVWEESGRSAAGNGSVMRCGPVALRWFDDDATLARNSVVSAAVTHWDPRCIWSTLLADFAIGACLRGEPIAADELLNQASAALHAAGAELAQFELPDQPPPDVLDAVAAALAPGAQVADLLLDSGGIGYAPKALGATLWAAHHAENVEEGLVAIVSAGGDTDTNAAPAGAALGARFGLEGIPPRWHKRINELREDREPLESHADLLLARLR